MTQKTCADGTGSSALHLKYWLFIVLLILILVATDRWSSQPKFTEFLSNAATMTSLMLGVVAILYSFIANHGLAQNLGNISVVSEDVKKSKDQIAEYLSKTKAVTDATEENRDALERISSTLSENLSSLRAALDIVAVQTGELPSRLEQLESSFNEAAKAIGAKPQNTAIQSTPQARFWTDAAVDRYLQRTPLNGNLLTIACVLAHSKNVEFSMTDFSTAIGNPKLQSYNLGMLAAMNATQIISRNIVRDKTGVYKITFVDQHLAVAARDYYVSYINRTYEGADLQSWKSKLTAIEALFP